jgi:hypothetical protein
MPGMRSYGLELDSSLADIKLVMTADCRLTKRKMTAAICSSILVPGNV